MKAKYKFLIELCNNVKAPNYNENWWNSATGYGYVTPSLIL